MCQEEISLPVLQIRTQQQMEPVINTTQDLTTTLIELATERKQDHIALVTLRLNFDSAQRSSSTSLSHKRALKTLSINYAQKLQEQVRKTDTVCLQRQHHATLIHFLLIGATIQGAEIVQKRLWDTVLWHVHQNYEEETRHPISMHIGYSAYVHQQSDVQQCIAEAAQGRTHFYMPTELLASQSILPTSNESTLSDMAQKLGIPYLALLPHKLPSGIKRLISPQLALELNCYPLGKERNALTVAISAPPDQQALERLQRETGLRIFPVLAHPHELQSALENFR
ncbi:MAG TPA: hypothetical protein VL461_14605 [Dictyobacter sp.]|jgi:hypothetical protein|nr:hypothetical protein [Dictyobacter sp.]